MMNLYGNIELDFYFTLNIIIALAFTGVLRLSILAIRKIQIKNQTRYIRKFNIDVHRSQKLQISV